MDSPQKGFYVLVHENGNTKWVSRGHRPARSLDTVVLRPALKNRIVEEATTFFQESTRTWYESHGIPYRRNLLFFGNGM